MAVAHCGDADPVDWLDENFEELLETVMTLATKVWREAEEENTVGTLSREEAVGAVRRNRGELWPSVTDCVEGRRTKVQYVRYVMILPRFFHMSEISRNMHSPI